MKKSIKRFPLTALGLIYKKRTLFVKQSNYHNLVGSDSTFKNLQFTIEGKSYTIRMPTDYFNAIMTEMFMNYLKLFRKFFVSAKQQSYIRFSAYRKNKKIIRNIGYKVVLHRRKKRVSRPVKWNRRKFIRTRALYRKRQKKKLAKLKRTQLKSNTRTYGKQKFNTKR